MTSLIFTKAAVARLLKIKPAQIVEYRAWAFVVWVHVKGQRPTMISKKAFYAGFVEFRKEGGKALEGSVITHSKTTYTVNGSRPYQIQAGDKIACTCEDYSQQAQAHGGGVCKHGYAVLGVLGFGSLAEYVGVREGDRLVAV